MYPYYYYYEKSRLNQVIHIQNICSFTKQVEKPIIFIYCKLAAQGFVFVNKVRNRSIRCFSINERRLNTPSVKFLLSCDDLSEWHTTLITNCRYPSLFSQKQQVPATHRHGGQKYTSGTRHIWVSKIAICGHIGAPKILKKLW